jgi:hypothetical protein
VRRAAIAFFAVAASCGGSEQASTTPANDAIVADTSSSDTSSDTTAAVDMGSDVDLFGAYPAGPYGNNVGDVVANLAWEGYVSPLADALANTKPYVTTSMDQLRRDAKKGYALVHVSEFY